MKKKILILLAFILVLGGGIGLGVYIRNETINPRAVIPNVFERILTWLVQRGVKEDDDLLYYNTGLADFIANGSSKTKVAVEGIVEKVTHEPDGDRHIILRPSYVPIGLSLVTETMPELNIPMPKEGDHIKIRGIARFDVLHNWWELHPVVGWEKIP